MWIAVHMVHLLTRGERLLETPTYRSGGSAHHPEVIKASVANIVGDPSLTLISYNYV